MVEITLRKRTLRGRGITKGSAIGEALVARKSLMFPHGVDPKTGQVVDERHELYGRNVAGKVLVHPHGRGSTSGATWFLETLRRGNGPIAIVNLETDPITAAASIMAEYFYGKIIPVVDRLDAKPIALIRSGDIVEVNADKGVVRILSRAL